MNLFSVILIWCVHKFLASSKKHAETNSRRNCANDFRHAYGDESEIKGLSEEDGIPALLEVLEAPSELIENEPQDEEPEPPSTKLKKMEKISWIKMKFTPNAFVEDKQ